MRSRWITTVATTSLTLALAASTFTGGLAFAKTHQAKKPVHTKTMATMQYAHANLVGVGKSKAHGMATLVLDTKTKVLTVTEKVWGLAKGLHPTHIHHDVNGKATGILYPLTNLDANAKGYAQAVTKIKGVTKIADNKQWIINVHLSGTNFAVVADGVVVAGK